MSSSALQPIMEQNDEIVEREEFDDSQEDSSSESSDGSSKIGFAKTAQENELNNLLKDSPQASAQKSRKKSSHKSKLLAEINQLSFIKSKTSYESVDRQSDGNGLNFEKLAGMGARQLDSDSQDSFDIEYLDSIPNDN